jgi:hypothetical protein
MLLDVSDVGSAQNKPQTSDQPVPGKQRVQNPPRLEGSSLPVQAFGLYDNFLARSDNLADASGDIDVGLSS